MHDEKESIPENTISAFARAIEKGYIIELDVSMTKDKRLVVFHDKKLKRLFGIDSYLMDMNYEDLQKLEFPNSKGKIPLFRDVLDFVNGRVPLIIEIKNEGKVGEMESMVYEELKGYPGQYAVQSFNPFTLSWFRKNAPDVLRGQLSGSFIVSDYEAEYAGTTRLPWYKRFILSNLLLNFESRPHFIAYEINNTDVKTFKKLRKLKVPVLGWTVREIAEYEKVKDVCDNFITEIFELN
ncbi:MAG: glycerophosphodiester phosphodiesterase [Clostridiaceae bacterium]|nr:glycerophosphodiester phosphodiesterase [Clostridiaceae bacterium]